MQSSGDANDQIHIEQLEVLARIGVTESERATPQRLTLSISIWPNAAFDDLEDDVHMATDYAALCGAARDFVSGRTDCLVETLATGLAAELLRTFPIDKVRLEVRKFVLPDAKYAAVIVTRNRQN